MTIPCSKGINIVPEEQAENSTNVEMETEQVKQMHVHALAEQKISKISFFLHFRIRGECFYAKTNFIRINN